MNARFVSKHPIFSGDTEAEQIQRWLKYAVVLFLLVAMAMASAFAQQVPSTIFASTADGFKNAMQGVENTMVGVARNLFLGLMTIEVMWAGVKYILDRDNPASLLKDLVALFVGRFLVGILVYKGPDMMRMLTGSFTQLGQMAAPGVSITSASSIADIGLDAFNAMWKALNLKDLISEFSTTLTTVVSGTVLLIAFAVTALQMLMTQIEFYIIASGAVFMLGFFGSKVTKQFAEKYISFVIGSGIKMFTTYLVIGASMPLVQQVVQMASTPDVTGRNLGAILVSSIIVAFLAWSIPGLAASIAAGTVNTSAAGAAGVAGSMAAGAWAAGALGMGMGRGGVGMAAGMGSAAGGGIDYFKALKGGGSGTAMAGARAMGATIGGVAGQGVGKAASWVSGGQGSVANSMGGRAGQALSDQATQMNTANSGKPPAVNTAAAGSAPAPASGGGEAQGASAASAGSTNTASTEGSAGGAVDSGSSAPGTSAAAANAGRGDAAAAAPRMPAPAVGGGGGGGKTWVDHATGMTSALQTPAESSASVGAGFSMNSEH